MDHLTRKDLKTDKFAEEVGHTVDYLSTHKSQVKLYGAIGAAVLVIGLGIYVFTHHQSSVREEALAKAIRISDAVVSAAPQPPNLNYNTSDEKEKAETKAYMDVAATYRGSQEGAIAQLHLAGIQLSHGKLDDAAKIYNDMLDSAPEDYASVAKLALAQIYAGEDKTADAEKLLRGVIAKPTVFVSKEEATLTLSDILAKSNPTEARKLLDSIKNVQRSAIDQAVTSALGKLTDSTPASN